MAAIIQYIQAHNGFKKIQEKSMKTDKAMLDRLRRELPLLRDGQSSLVRASQENSCQLERISSISQMCTAVFALLAVTRGRVAPFWIRCGIGGALVTTAIRNWSHEKAPQEGNKGFSYMTGIEVVTYLALSILSVHGNCSLKPIELGMGLIVKAGQSYFSVQSMRSNTKRIENDDLLCKREYNVRELTQQFTIQQRMGTASHQSVKNNLSNLHYSL